VGELQMPGKGTLHCEFALRICKSKLQLGGNRPGPAGAVCLFAYLYLRPLIRRQLGSASK